MQSSLCLVSHKDSCLPSHSHFQMLFLFPTHPQSLRLYTLKQVENIPKECVTQGMKKRFSEAATLNRTASKGNISWLVGASCLTK